MGSTTFHLTAPATLTAREAYNSLTEQALHEFGHDGYNGTISTTDGFTIPTDQVLSSEEAHKLADERIGNLNKWDDCEALRIGDAPLLSTRTLTRNLSVPSGSDAEATAADSVTLRPGELVAAVTLIGLPVKSASKELAVIGRTSSNISRKVVKTRSVTIAAGKEKTETRFFIISPNNSRMPAWSAGHPTQAAARAALTLALPKEYEENSWGGGVDNGQYEIISMTRRVDGSALVTADVTHTATKARYDIVIEKRGDIGEQTSWLFYGWAAC